MVARELLTESGSVFVQIGDENVHLVRAVLDEVFGSENFVVTIIVREDERRTAESCLTGTVTTTSSGTRKIVERVKYRQLCPTPVGGAAWRTSDTLVELRRAGGRPGDSQLPKPAEGLRFQLEPARVHGTRRRLRSSADANGGHRASQIGFRSNSMDATSRPGMQARLEDDTRAEWTGSVGGSTRCFGQQTRDFIRYLDDFPFKPIDRHLDGHGLGGASDAKVYVVQTNTEVIERCVLMTTDPGDLVLDPTCGSGTTAYVAEQWGRRWITIDTSRVALALARSRLMAAQYPYYLLADSEAGIAQGGRAHRSGAAEPDAGDDGDIRQGFVYERVPHVTLKSIAQNPDIREGMTREEIDAAIARHAETEILFDRPYEDRRSSACRGRSRSRACRRTGSCIDGPEDEPRAESAPVDGRRRGSSRRSSTTSAAPACRTPSARSASSSTRLDPYPGVYVQAIGEYGEDGQVEDGRRRDRPRVRHRRPGARPRRRQGGGQVRRPARRVRLRVRPAGRGRRPRASAACRSSRPA